MNDMALPVAAAGVGMQAYAFAALCEFLMCDDPHTDDELRDIADRIADHEAQSRGFKNWIDYLHAGRG